MKKCILGFMFLFVSGFIFGQQNNASLNDGSVPIHDKGNVSELPVDGTMSNSITVLPQYYNYDTYGSGNYYPWYDMSQTTNGKKVQLLFAPGAFSNPKPAPTGSITSIAFKVNDLLTPGQATYTDLTIKIGQSTITSFTAGDFYNGVLTAVYYRSSVQLTPPVAGGWMTITLDTPFGYDPTKSLIVDIDHCGVSGTGFLCCYTILTGNTRNWSDINGCPIVYQEPNSYTYHFGFNMVAATQIPLSDWPIYMVMLAIGVFLFVVYRKRIF